MDIPRTSEPLTIDVVSDVVCPWCYLGKRRLERALDLVPATPVVIRWRPFQLDASVPPEGMDRQEYMRGKFGDLSRIDAAHERLAAFGKAEGIDYRFDEIRRAPNTIDAHRLVRWTPVELQEAIVETLFRAYFTEGRDIGNHAVLAELGATGRARSGPRRLPASPVTRTAPRSRPRSSRPIASASPAYRASSSAAVTP